MSKTFVLKDSPPELIAAAQVEPKGRTYDKGLSKEPGAIRLDELILGMKLASIAITDDNEGTLAKVSKTDPWHAEALKVITGSEEEAHKPLTHILSEHFNLECDSLIDISGFKAGYALDTQGYIAHNDEMVVLAYRCTTSGKDWLTNLTTTSSEWEPDEDIAQGHSGYFSCLDGLCGQDQYKPRVHTGFYNNFLASAPLVKQHIDPLLGPDQPPRKLYVVGHSLGAGIATMAACYFLLEHKWEELPHRLVHVTAGSPRACMSGMRDVIQAEMDKLRPLDKAVICRIVRDKDVVASVPPSTFGFVHLDKLVYITRDGKVLINPELDDEHIITESEMKELQVIEEDTATETEESDSEEDEDNEEKEKKAKSSYEKKVSMVPRAFRDHMPDFYLKPLIKLFEEENPPQHDPQLDDNPVVESLKQEVVQQAGQGQSSKKTKKRFSFFRRGKSKQQRSQ